RHERHGVADHAHHHRRHPCGAPRRHPDPALAHRGRRELHPRDHQLLPVSHDETQLSRREGVRRSMSDTKVTAPSLFTLTKITGRRRTEDRTIIIQSFEVNRRKFNVFLLGLIPTLPLTGIAALFIGAYSIVVPVLVMPLWFFLVDRRSPHGLQ